MKRAFDFFASLLGLLILSPLLALVAVAIRVTDPGPVFFVQRRVGRGGRSFSMWKFRTMRTVPGSSLTIGDDPRITAVGRILRRAKIDELPQLWNVVTGDMSLVGPRPEIEKYVAVYSEEQRRVLELQPGITDPASFVYFDEAERLAGVVDPESHYISALMPEKIRLNLEYAARRGFLSDLMVIVLTVLRPLGVKVDLLRVLGMVARS